MKRLILFLALLPVALSAQTIQRWQTAKADTILSPTTFVFVNDTLRFAYFLEPTDSGTGRVWMDQGGGIGGWSSISGLAKDSNFIMLRADTIRAYVKSRLTVVDSTFFQGYVNVADEFEAYRIKSTLEIDTAYTMAKVPSTRTISAGVGISSTGLGDLGSNRTVNVDTATVIASKAHVSATYVPRSDTVTIVRTYGDESIAGEKTFSDTLFTGYQIGTVGTSYSFASYYGTNNGIGIWGASGGATFFDRDVDSNAIYYNAPSDDRKWVLYSTAGLASLYRSSKGYNIWSLDSNGVQFMREVSASPDNLTNYGKLYAKTDGKLYFLASDSTEHDLTARTDTTLGTAAEMDSSRVATLDKTQTFTGTKTLSTGYVIDSLGFWDGSEEFIAWITNPSLTENRSLKYPDASGTLTTMEILADSTYAIRGDMMWSASLGSAAYMDSTRVMTLDKTQTVTGVKTFASNLTIQKASPVLTMDETALGPKFKISPSLSASGTLTLIPYVTGAGNFNVLIPFRAGQLAFTTSDTFSTGSIWQGTDIDTTYLNMTQIKGVLTDSLDWVRDSVAALRGDIGSGSGDVSQSDSLTVFATPSQIWALEDSVGILRDSIDALRGDIGSGSGTFLNLSVDGYGAITDSVNLVAGVDITLSQAGNDITIALDTSQIQDVGIDFTAGEIVIAAGTDTLTTMPNAVASITGLQDSLNARVTDAILNDSLDGVRTWVEAQGYGTGSGTSGNITVMDASFTTTATKDTVTWSGAHTYDSYQATPYASSADDSTGDVLMVYPDTNRVIVSRKFGGTSGLNYNLHRIAGTLAPPTAFDATQGADSARLAVSWTAPVTSTSATARPIDSIAITWSKSAYPASVAAAGDSVKRVIKTTTSDTLTGLTPSTLYYIRAFSETYKHEYNADTSSARDTCTTSAGTAGGGTVADADSIIVRDTVSAYTAYATSLGVSLNVTSAWDNRTAIVWVGEYSGRVDSVVRSGVNFTRIDSSYCSSFAGLRVSAWRLDNVATGTATATAYFSAGSEGSMNAMVLSGVDLDSTITTVIDQGGYGTTQCDLNITADTTRAAFDMAVTQGATTRTPSAGQTSLYAGYTGGAGHATSRRNGEADGSVNMAWTFGAATHGAQLAISVKAKAK